MLNVLRSPKFLDAAVDTYFIDENPDLMDIAPSRNRAQKLLKYIGEVRVNGPSTPLFTNLKPSKAKAHVPEIPSGL